MRITRKQLYAAGIVGGLVVVWWWLRRPSSSAPPSVAGTVSSGSQSTTIETNVLNPNFGLPLPN